MLSHHQDYVSGARFIKLLDVMWSSEDDRVRRLAKQVRSRLTKAVVVNGEQ